MIMDKANIKTRKPYVEHSKKDFLKTNWFGILTIILAVTVLLIFVFATDSYDQLKNALVNFESKWLILSLISILIYWLSDAATLNVLTRQLYNKYSFLYSFKTRMIGLLYNGLTPFASGGEPMQIYEMSKTGIKPGDASSVIAVKSLIFQICMTVFGIIAVIFSWNIFHNKVDFFLAFIIFGVVTNVAFISIMLLICTKKETVKKIFKKIINFINKLKIIKKPDELLDKTYKQIDIFYFAVMEFKNKPSIIISCVLITIVQLLSFYSIPYSIYRGLGLSETTLITMIMANAFINMATAFVPIPGGSGAAEGSFYLFFSAFFPKSLLLPAVMLWRGLTYYSSIIVGGIMSLFTIEKKR